MGFSPAHERNHSSALTRPESSSGLYWSKRGEIACPQHAPEAADRRWAAEGWQPLKPPQQFKEWRYACVHCHGTLFNRHRPATAAKQQPDAAKPGLPPRGGVPTHDPFLPVPCPKCSYKHVSLYLSSATALTNKCPYCAFCWSVEIAALPTDTRNRLARAIRDQ